MNETMQDDDLAKDDLREHARLKGMRAPFESTYQEMDDRFPDGAGGFNRGSIGDIRGQRNFDTTHLTSLDRFAAAGVAITTPEQEQYIRIKFLDEDLMKLRSVQLWCSMASPRMYSLRHALHTGFSTAASEDWNQLGRYGTGPVLTDGRPGIGFSYQALHLSQVYIDVDAARLVDTVHRCYRLTARQLEKEFGEGALTAKMLDALHGGNGKENTEFELIHVIVPNRDWDGERLDWRRFPIASRFLAVDEKLYLRRGGYWSMPISVSRHVTSPGEIYGRSPAIQQAPTIAGLNAMRHTTLRAGHKAVDPALLFPDDSQIKRLATRAGGLNPGLVDDNGRPLVARMPGGEQGIPYALEMIEGERGVVKSAFIEEFYKILTDPNSRMTSTEVLEVMAKQGVLIRPFASRYATEKQDPMSQRELELALRYGQLPPLPPEVKEAGVFPRMEYENPLAKMGRADSASSTMRYLQAIPTLAELDPGVRHRVNADAIAVGMAAEMGIKPEYLRSDDEVAALLQQDKEAQDEQQQLTAFEQGSGATLNLAKANQLSQAA